MAKKRAKMKKQYQKSNRKLGMKDLPKEVLVDLIKHLNIEFSEEAIVETIIRHRLRRASGHARKHQEIMEEASKTNIKRKRRDLEIEANRHAVNLGTLYQSAKKMVADYGLGEKFPRLAG